MVSSCKFILLVFVFSAFGCSSKHTPEESRGKLIAKVDESELRESDLQTLFGSDYQIEDLNVKVYVNNWVANEVVVQAANAKLSEQEKDFSEQLNQYKQSLLRYTLESKYVAEHIDSNITQAEVQAYYDSNAVNFELKENHVKACLLKMPKDFKFSKKAREMINFKSEEEKLNYELWAKKNELTYFNLDTAWVKWEAVKELSPIKLYNDEHFLSNNNFKELWFEDEIWLIRIIDYKLKDNTSPLEMVENRIRSILINKRKVALIKRMEKELYQAAIQNGKIKMKLSK